MKHIPIQILASRSRKIPLSYSYPYTTDVWIERTGDILAKIKAVIAFIIIVVNVKGTVYIQRRNARIEYFQGFYTSRPVQGDGAIIDQARFYCIGDVIVQI